MWAGAGWFLVYVVTEMDTPEGILMFASDKKTTFLMLLRTEKHLSFVFRIKSGM